MRSKIIQWLGITLLLETGLIHYYTAQSQYDKSGYMGYVYVAFFLATLISIFGIYHRQVWGWGIGLVLSVGSIVVFFWVRTLGLPGMALSDWLEPFDIVAASVEALFIVFYLLRRPGMVQPDSIVAPANSRFTYFLPVAGFFLLASLGALAYRWDAAVTREFGHHVASLEVVCSTPLTSFAELESRYGVQVSLIATSMVDTVIDVRLKVIDPEKAAVLLKNQAALLVGQEALILAPHQHHHGSIQRDKVHFMFFPTQNNTVHTGSVVSLVFGAIRVEPLTVR